MIDSFSHTRSVPSSNVDMSLEKVTTGSFLLRFVGHGTGQPKHFSFLSWRSGIDTSYPSVDMFTRDEMEANKNENLPEYQCVYFTTNN